MFVVMSIRFAGETRWQRALGAARRGISRTPDMGTRHSVIAAAAPSGAIVGFLVTMAGVAISWMLGQPTAANIALRAGTVLASWSLVAGFRQYFEVRDHRAWTTAGQPDSWRPTALSQPVSTDLAVWLVLSIVLSTVVTQVGVTRGG
ncbi:hypothetical protein KQI48_11290 [Cellulomonas hominis]|uniref:hypothetical protein n=1 Tax=Cellulomonas hominis TaxID=156981 RepID=UPI001C0F7AB0|nr:hypothetical protein [Cellulomonas hominis]MBU5423250.1 hypothetical protein [Cellulomonas hominis]